MISISQTNVSVSIRRTETEIIAHSTYLDTSYELSAEIIADIHSLEIKTAMCEVLKTPDFKDTGIKYFEFPKGTTCYVDDKKVIRNAIKDPKDEKAKYLFLQCVNGVIQADSYIYEDRGFTTKSEYNEYWDNLEINGCRWFKYRDNSDPKWLNYVPRYNRKNVLFNRYKNFELRDLDDRIEGHACFSDSFHELYLDIGCSKNGIFDKYEITFQRGPGQACFDNSMHGKKMLGLNVMDLKSLDVVDLLGRSEGCYHLVELSKDMISKLSEYINK